MIPRQQPVEVESDRDVHLRDYWNIVWRGRWTVLAVFALVVGATVAWTLLQTPVFRATAVVEVQPQARRLAPGQDVSGLGVSSYGWFAEERYQNTQLEIIRSRDVAGRAFAALGLRSDPGFSALPDPVGAFIGRYKAEPRRETGLIEISVEGRDRAVCARWSNAVADAYVARNLDQARQNTERALEQIRKQVEPLKSDVAKAEEQRFQVLQDARISNPKNEQEVVKQRLLDLNRARSKTQEDIARLQSLLAKIEDVQATGADPMSLPELSQDATLLEIQNKRVDVEKELERAKVEFKPGHPVYQARLAEVQKIQRAMREQISLIQSQKRNEYEVAIRNSTILDAQIREAQDFAFRVDQATSKYEVVNVDAQSKKQIFDSINKTLNDITISAQLLANNVSVLDYAQPPVAPVKPRKMLNLIMGCMFGLFLGLGAVFFMDYLDNTLRSPEDIERYIKLATLAVIPKFDPAEAAPRAAREAFQTLRTGLIFSSRNRERKVVLVTSTAPQEGKSSTVAHLARALAGAGERVLVIDCDLRRPTQHLHLKLQREPGLTSYLAAPRGVEDWTPFVKVVGPDNLRALTCGPIPPNPPELLGSERFSRLLAEARDQYDWIVVDSPPAVSLSDANVLATQADMLMLVIRHNKTDRHHVARIVAQLRQIGVEVTGCILNSVDLDRSKSDYYYAGYYYYTEDEGSGSTRRKKAGTKAQVG